MKELSLKKGVKAIGWTPKVVYSVYCNDDLNTLPVGILSDMKLHLQTIIDSKNGIDNKLKIQDEDYLSVKDFKGDEILHIEYDYTVAGIVDQVVKLVKYINERS